MSFEQLKNAIPDFAKDIKLNLTTVLAEESTPELQRKQIWSVALASAFATQQPNLIALLSAAAAEHLSEAESAAAKSAAAIMAMNNVYYRFTHLVSDKAFATLPAKLRMNVIGHPGVEKADFELSCLAISALNGCGMCLDAHTHALTKIGVSTLAIQSAVRIAAVINAAACSLAIASHA